MRPTLLAALTALALPAAASGQTETEPPPPPPPAKAPSPTDIVNAASQSEWAVIAPEDMLVMTLAPLDRGPGQASAAGKERTVIIQLMPAPFSQGWVSNIKTLARAKWYDGVSVNRVQDNYVVQWGDPGHDNPESGDVEPKPLPEGLKVMGEDEYTVDHDTLAEADIEMWAPEEMLASLGSGGFLWVADSALEAVLSSPDATQVEKEAAIQEYLKLTEGVAALDELDPDEIPMISIRETLKKHASQGWHQRDSYAEWVEFWKGWPIANLEKDIQWIDANENKVSDPELTREEAADQGYFKEVGESRFWPVHCYGMVGVGRGYSPDTGSGAELYAVIGHAPRHLDRNIALVGRVISGMEHLSSMPRGSGALGFYTEEEADLRTSIVSIRVAADLPEDEQPLYEYLSTQNASFERYVAARAARRDPFFIVPAGGADICNIPVPIRRFEYADEE